MKKLSFTILPLLFLGLGAFAQPAPDQRALHTKVADVLARFPANNRADLNKYFQEISSFGASGISQMADLLSAPGKGDNTRMEYALAGYAFYVTAPGQENNRATAVKAYSQAAAKATNPEVKAFLIRQVQTLAGNPSVATLTPFLADERLCDPAARALVKINTAESKQALLTALGTATGKRQITLVQALGDASAAEANAAIIKLASGSNGDLAKVSNYALARIADPAAANTLKANAAKAGYGYDRTNATASYLTYLAALSDKKLATSLATALLPVTKGVPQENAYVAALNILSANDGAKALATWITATNDSRPRVKNTAWKLIAAHTATLIPAQQAMVLKQFGTADNVTKAAAIRIFADNKAEYALPAITGLMSNQDPQIRTAAIDATGRIGGIKHLPVLITTFNSSDPATVEAVENALLIMPGSEVVTAVAAAFPNLTTAAKSAAITVLAARKATEQGKLITDAAAGTDANLRTAAYKALPAIANQQSVPVLVTLVNGATNSLETTAAQQALINAAISPEQAKQFMQAAPAASKSRYLGVLAGIGSKDALGAVVDAFNNGDATTKDAAIRALADWSNADAALPLLNIARNKEYVVYQEQALLGYVGLASAKTIPADQKVLMVRNALDITSSEKVQLKALQVLNKCKSYNALLLAGRYLESPNLGATAADAVMDIALADKSYAGPVVKTLLEKASAQLKGGDADYQRQSIRKYLNEMPAGEGFVSMFNGTDLSGWKGLVENPVARGKMTEKALKSAQTKANEKMNKGWSVKDGLLVFNGEGDNLCTEKKYGDFEMLVDWKITAKGDAGIYLRGTPQVQIWDTSRTDVGAEVGSGGLYNNQSNVSKPLVLADNAIGEWNHFHIIMKGDRVTVYLNGQLVTNNTIMENYWEKGLPIFPEEQIELQAHGTYVAYRDLYIKELPRPKPFVLSAEEKKAGFKVLFDGTNMQAWTGNTTSYIMEEGNLVIYPKLGGSGNLFTKEEFKDFIYRFEFQLTPGANNGLGIRAPLEGNAAYNGMELQIIDNEADMYKNLHEYQYHGSVYGVIPAKRGFLKPVGEWNYEEVVVKGNNVKVILNGETILDGDIAAASANGTLDHKDHPGLKNEKGHIGFLGHGDVVRFRNIRVKSL
ncbi:HEAT repeat [Chitinophaga jiangningensis]|uniref:HEAT repeat n=1 Tax=Chitinophaga jiangningensis TaxID=1419482 RepID=A0A1M7M2U5_9BACT|nr:family 16 glycoside hydrolase [Chitinophaga jiangningensis]SHM84523.1 HEAT repeat [Chitinophaga jiangningensis]